MTLTPEEIQDLMADYMVKLSKAKQQNNKSLMKIYDYQIRLLEIAYHKHA